MIDITRETIVSLSDAANRLSVTHKTIRKWASMPGRKLETAKVGGKVITSLEALQRFSDQRGDGETGSPVESGPRGPRPDKSTAAAVADAKRRLAAIGVTA